MLTYDALYEYLRKEKYSEKLQLLPKTIVSDFSDYIDIKKKQFELMRGDSFADDLLREKKQYENAITLFKDLMLRRKKKILDLVFVAAETGIMKKDFEDMLIPERELFEKLVSAVVDGDKAFAASMRKSTSNSDEGHKLITMIDDVEEFIDMQGNIIGPFKKGNIVNIDSAVANILVNDSKARFVDEKD